jgi:hypothetical protein
VRNLHDGATLRHSLSTSDRIVEIVAQLESAEPLGLLLEVARDAGLPMPGAERDAWRIAIVLKPLRTAERELIHEMVTILATYFEASRGGAGAHPCV